MIIIFWIFLVAIFYTYFGYPLFLELLSLLKKTPVKKKEISPKVSLIIAAYNEEETIEEKIKNSIALQYEKNKLEIIVASDCSDDKTDIIVSKYSNKGIKLVRLGERGGKTAVQNLAAERAKGEILVFSDATTIYAQDAIKKIVKPFADNSVGCVSGKLIFLKSNHSTDKTKSFIEEYDHYLKSKESQIETMFGVNGCFYAVRKKLYPSIDTNLTSDFAVPLKIIEGGFRVIYEEEAISFEKVSLNILNEFKRKKRTVRAGIGVFLRMKRLLNPFRRKFVFWGVISHKLMRWLTPIFLFLIFCSNLIIVKSSFFYKITFLLQVIFYLFAVVGYLLFYKKKVRLFTIPFYFCLVNFAAVIGMIELVRKEKSEIWQPIR